MLDRGYHQIAHILGGYTAGRGDKTHRLPVAAVEREGDTDLSPLSQPISRPSEHQRVLRVATAIRPSCRRSAPRPE
jgi:hypothetical protein